LPDLPPSQVPVPAAADIESVVFIVGDMGNAMWDRSPLPHALQAEIETWSGALRRDSSVSIVFLGDNVYPKGLRLEPEYFPIDSAHLETQVNIFTGPNARRYKAFGMFIAGNHDWGQTYHEVGLQRLRNQQEFLSRRRERGIHVALMPSAGLPGPGIVDIGRYLRFLLIDTAWWLLSADDAEKQRTITRLQDQMTRDRGREIVIASHHPFKSASSHGGLVSFWSTVGVEWLLYKSGATLQDLNSLPYRDFLNRVTDVFTITGPPLLHLGGHDHALQLLRSVTAQEPRYMVVSGSGSKSSKIGHTDGMMFRSSDPGYMQLIVEKNGSMSLFIYSAPVDFLMCNRPTPETMAQCLEVGKTEFKNRYGIRLK
jgi:hypothetical protein